MQLLKGFIIA